MLEIPEPQSESRNADVLPDTVLNPDQTARDVGLHVSISSPDQFIDTNNGESTLYSQYNFEYDILEELSRGLWPITGKNYL